MTIVVRLLFSIILGICFNMGVIGIALAMGIDWTVRGIIFWVRQAQCLEEVPRDLEKQFIV